MKKLAGFSLTELMITVGIIAILAAVAYPSYRSQVIRSNRAEARTALLQVQVAQEKFFLQNNRYAGSTTATLSAPELNNSPTAAVTPGLGVASTTPSRHYTIELRRPSTSTYEVRAIPNGSQADDTTCGTFTLIQSGVRTPNAPGCWK